MAIDFMIMPLSRYISRDFVTPEMAFAWKQGLAYQQFRPEGDRDFPPGIPFGGAGAPQHRMQIMTMLDEDLRALPQGIPHQLWDERSNAEPRYHRVDVASYKELLNEASSKNGGPLHMTTTLYLPADFNTIFEMETPLERPTGSAERALNELDRLQWRGSALPARLTLMDALRDALDLRLPMIVDA